MNASYQITHPTPHVRTYTHLSPTTTPATATMAHDLPARTLASSSTATTSPLSAPTAFSTPSLANLTARHIQDYSDASSLEPHWGYYDRVVPCTNDAGSCAYLDEVYSSHDRGMFYAGAMWMVIFAIITVLAVASRSRWRGRKVRGVASWVRRWGLPDSRIVAASRLQVTMLAAALVYLAIFSFIGISYKHWVTPVKNTTLTNYRSSLGPFVDRIGILSYALTPLSILLASRESLLSAATGLPHTAFAFLHRWTGHVILLQAVVHTIGWCVIEIALYQPQPTTAIAWIKQTYMVWGVVALILLLLLWILATPWARRLMGYEAFRKAHYILAMLFIGACWGHWAQLKCFMIPSLLFWFADRGARFARTALIHYRVLPTGGAFTTIPAKITQYGDCVRLDLDASTTTAMATDFDVGQHFYLTFPQCSIWQSHPFTPLSLPGRPQSYIIRCKRGETLNLASLTLDTTPTVICGPYGSDTLAPLSRDSNVLAIAGGTGITFVVPAAIRVAQLVSSGRASGKVTLVWSVRHARDVSWCARELAELAELGADIRIHVTRGKDEAGIDDGVDFDGDESLASLATAAESGRPDVRGTVERFVSRVNVGPTTVFCSGPSGMVRDARAAVAGANDPKRVWAGEEERDVSLVVDDRFE